MVFNVRLAVFLTTFFIVNGSYWNLSLYINLWRTVWVSELLANIMKCTWCSNMPFVQCNRSPCLLSFHYWKMPSFLTMNGSSLVAMYNKLKVNQCIVNNIVLYDCGASNDKIVGRDGEQNKSFNLLEVVLPRFCNGWRLIIVEIIPWKWRLLPFEGFKRI